MSLIFTRPIFDWVTVSNLDDGSIRAFRASDVRYIAKKKTENGLWTLTVYVHPADVTIVYGEASEEDVQQVFGTLMGLAHKADTEVRRSDCVSKQPKE